VLFAEGFARLTALKNGSVGARDEDILPAAFVA